ncbi:MAG: EamA family transporter [bacterium]
MWQIFAVICMVAFAVQNLVIKATSSRDTNQFLVFWFMMAGAVPVLFGFFIIFGPHHYEPELPFILLIAVTGNLVAFYGYIRSIQLADVSLATPLLSLTPFFMLLTSWLILGEVPDLPGLLGILAVVVGTYFLTTRPGDRGIEPLIHLWDNRGCRWALATSFLWSITANIDKFGVEAATPVSYSFWFHVLFTVFLTPVLFFYRDDIFSGQNFPGDSSGKLVYMLLYLLLGVGMMQALLSGSQMVAITSTNVSYVIALKRAGMLITVLGGGLIFGEKYTARRFVSGLIVLVGLLGIIFR